MVQKFQKTNKDKTNKDITRIYGLFGMDYLSIPEDMRGIVLQSYERNVDKKQLLAQLEDCIKKVYGSYKKDDNYAADQRMHGEKRCLQILLEARRRVMNKMFCLTEDTFNQFVTINGTLLDLSKKVGNKVLALYNAWLKDEEAAWRNDCNVEGTIFAEGWKEGETDETGSDYCAMMEVIEEVDNRDLYKIGFSGCPDRIPDHSYEWNFSTTSARLFCGGGEQLFGDFTMCKAFYRLYTDSLYSHYDILRIKMYWADVALTHQRIVTPKGELL